jgi:hypothetical protein
MTDIALPTTTPASLRTMAGIEARRLARHPAFIVGVVLAFGVVVLLYVLTDDPHQGDLLSMPVIPAFFIGLTSLVATARLTRSTEATAEAIGTAPGSEARRTAALALACFVPFAAGAVWVGVQLALISVHGAHPYEWWFGTMPDWQVWTILLALGPVACLGGGLLGVLTGRWLRFPGAAAVMVVVVVVVDMLGQGPFVNGSALARLWVPWAMFHSGTENNGTATLYAGNSAFYLIYALCLCAAAALVAIWHDRTARTGRMRAAIVGVVVLGLASLALAMTTGNDHNQTSKPIPYKVND